MHVTLTIFADRDINGYAVGVDGTLLEFGQIKMRFRDYLDEVWDHHLHLNSEDPWSQLLLHEESEEEPRVAQRLPGLRIWQGDPSTENIAWWISEYVGTVILPGMQISIHIDETGTNGVSAP
jgi:6-pyruvoyl-tetrahydropterin synthase